MAESEGNQNVPSRGHAIWIACVVSPIITGVFVALRAYTKTFITKKIHLNDWVAFITMAWIIAFSITLAQATYNGMGRHTSDFTKELEANMYFWILVSSEFYVLSLAGYKSALILLYLQLFGIYRRFRYICYAVLFYVNGYLLCNLIVEVAGCHPVSKFWEPKTPGHCTNSVAQDIAFGAMHMTSDLMIAILPLPMIYRLQLRSTREKLGLAAVLGSGLVAFTVAAVRFTYASIDLTSKDRTWIAGITFFLSVLEVNTGLICSSTPALKPFFKVVKDQSSNLSLRKNSLWPSNSNERSRKRSEGIVGVFENGTKVGDDRGFVELKGVNNDHSSESQRRQVTTDTVRRDPFDEISDKNRGSRSNGDRNQEQDSDTWDHYEGGITEYDADARPSLREKLRSGLHMTDSELFEGTALQARGYDGHDVV